MRVGIYGRPLEGNFVGIGRYIVGLVDGLQKAGVKCTLFLSSPLKHNPFSGRLPKIVVVPGYDEKTMQSEFFWTQIHLRKAIEHAKLDLFHATDNYRYPFSLTVPVVLTVHDLIPLTQTLEPLHRTYFEYSTLDATQNARRIIAISRSTQADVERYMHVPKNKITLVHEGFEFALPNVGASQKANVLKLYAITKPYVIYVGGITQRKNIDSALRAFALMKNHTDYQFVIVGNMENPYGKFLQATVKKLGIQKQIVFTGFVTEREKFILLQNSRMLVYPSFAEGFGIPVLEGFAARTPVVASRVAGLQDTAGMAAYFVNPRKIGDIQKAIQRLLVDNHLREQFISRGERRLAHFSQEHMAEETIAVYRQVLRLAR